MYDLQVLSIFILFYLWVEKEIQLGGEGKREWGVVFFYERKDFKSNSV